MPTLRFLLASIVVLSACGGDDGPRRGIRDAGPGPFDAGPAPMRDAGFDAAPSGSDPDVVARAAVVVASCLGGSAAELLHGAYGGVYGQADLRALLRQHAVCLATNGGGCAAVDACLGFELDVPGDCTPDCDGDTAVICPRGGHVRWRCPDVGLTCAAGICTADPAMCAMPTCDGNVPVDCVGTPQRGPDCSVYGLSCAQPTGPGACVGTGEACMEDIPTTTTIDFVGNGIECVGTDTLATCINGMRHEISCAGILAGMTCRITSDVDMRAYCGLSNRCNPFTSVVEFCSGNDIAVCNAGSLENVSCLDLGFSRCSTGRCT